MTKQEKALATRQAKKEQMQSQTVTIDENWRILRSDELNWEIQFHQRDKWTFQGYYGTISSALKALPAKMLSEIAKGSLSDVLRSLEGITATIEKAIPA